MGGVTDVTISWFIVSTEEDCDGLSGACIGAGPVASTKVAVVEGVPLLLLPPTPPPPPPPPQPASAAVSNNEVIGVDRKREEFEIISIGIAVLLKGYAVELT